MERKRHLLLICFLAALALALGASTAVYWTRSARQARALESVSQRSLSQLLSSLSSMETLLEKTRYAGSGPLRSLLAAQLWNESQLAAAAFGALPLGDEPPEQLETFLAQTGDYAYYLLRASAYDRGDEGEWETLSALADKTGWYTQGQLADMVAISESTPGPIGVNMATYVGFTTRGVPGALTATIGLITPSVIVILIIARMLKTFKDSRYVKNAFYGLRPASTGLIAAAGFSVVLLALTDTAAYQASGSLLDLFHWKGILLAAVLLFFTRVPKKTKDLHPVVYIAASAAVGILFHFAGV